MEAYCWADGQETGISSEPNGNLIEYGITFDISVIQGSLFVVVGLDRCFLFK